MMARHTPLRQAKLILRNEIKDKLKNMTETDKSLQSGLIINKALNQEEYKESSRISIFLPMPDEVNTLPLLKKMFQDNKQCFIPHFEGQSMIMVPLKSWEEYEALPLNSWNIKQPATFDTSQDAFVTGGLDLIFMPGLAFTPEGARLGRGKGFYDKYLDRCIHQGKKPKTVGLAFHQQILQDIPLNDHDVLIDKIVFPLPQEISSIGN